jgi:phenylacetate-coenzyme A ligase PaaK-like adenylate-forming protein
VIDLDTGLPAAPGRLGTVVVTPYYPYRECMPVFRYDTRDVVRCPPEGPLECDLAGIPATSRILGKADHLLHTDDGTVTRRELVEVIEGLPSEPWPARFAATVEGGHLRLRVGGAHAPSGDGELRERLLEAGFHVDLTTEPTPAILPLRADLLETTFSGVRS